MCGVSARLSQPFAGGATVEGAAKLGIEKFTVEEGSSLVPRSRNGFELSVISLDQFIVKPTAGWAS